MTLRPHREKLDVENYLVERVSLKGGLALKVKAEGLNGMLDRMIVLPGGCVGFIETKSETGTPSAMQKLVKRRLERRGVSVHFAFNRAEVDKAIDAIAHQHEATL